MKMCRDKAAMKNTPSLRMSTKYANTELATGNVVKKDSKSMKF